MAENDGGATRARAPTRPTIALPPRTSGENMFAGGADASPGPMTLVSSFFSENDPDSEYRSFSQLLAGAMGSPVAVMEKKPSFSTEKGDKELEEKELGDGGEKEEKDFRFTQNRSLGLVVAQPPMFTVPPGLSPTSLFESPRFFTPGQLLTGAMGSPALLMEKKPSFSMENGEKELKDKEYGDGGDKQEKDFRFTQNRPLGLMVAQSSMFTIPPGLSPTSLFESPRLFTPGQGPFGMSHQQALAQVTAQAAQSQSQFHMPNEYPSSMLAPPATSSDQQPSYGIFPVQMQNPRTTMTESSVVPYSDQRAQPPLNVDKPADDGYNWRKYGQKQVKGSEFPRSYYKCTHPNCPVKKKVERSLDGHVTEIIYKGQHNHQPPQHIKRSKDGSSNGKQNLSGNPEMGHQDHGGNLARSNQNLAIVSKFSRDQESSQATPEQLSGSSDGEEVGDAETRVEEDEDQPDPKRRNTEVRVFEPAASHRAVTEPRIIVQTTSEVDLLDDGYRWRKYGQKVVKGNPHPRSYYKCTSTGCNVRKHVERAATDIKAVITTYEGKHNHDVPAAKNSSHNTANSNVPQIKPQNPVSEKHALVNKRDFGGSDLRFKEEQVT